MKVLFIGGTGIISSACVALAVERGIDVTLLNRGISDRPIPKGVRALRADVHDTGAIKSIIGNERFDAVADFIAFVPEHVKRDIEVFRGRTNQLIFISSASAYQTPPLLLPITESSPLRNPIWKYSSDKIACESALIDAYHDEGFPDHYRTTFTHVRRPTNPSSRRLREPWRACARVSRLSCTATGLHSGS